MRKPCTTATGRAVPGRFGWNATSAAGRASAVSSWTTWWTTEGSNRNHASWSIEVMSPGQAGPCTKWTSWPRRAMPLANS